jgi:hypothetical protein
MFADRWASATRPEPVELLSGYLCRVAVACGVTPYGFCESQFGDRSFWTRDSDRGIICRQVEEVADRSGLSREEVQALTLRNWLDVLAPPAYIKRRATAVIPWVNVVGLYHRTRRHHGLQYCPMCLREHALVPKIWRLSFVVHCPVHDIALRDSCPHCDAPFVPHRAMGRLDMCHACGGWLTVVEHREVVNRVVKDLQAAMLGRLTRPTDPTATGLGDADLMGMRHLVSMFFMKAHAADMAKMLGTKALALRGPRLEMSRHPRRVAFLQACAAIASDWPSYFQYLARLFELTQRRFVRVRGSSAWLDAEIAKLPERNIKPRVLRAVKPASAVQRLEIKKPENWRALRAAVLLKRTRPP